MIRQTKKKPGGVRKKIPFIPLPLQELNPSVIQSPHRPPPSRSAAKNRQSMTALESAPPLLEQQRTIGALVRSSPDSSMQDSSLVNASTAKSLTVFPTGIGPGRVLDGSERRASSSLLHVVHPAHEEMTKRLMQYGKDIDEIIESLLDLEEALKKKADVSSLETKADTVYCQELVYAVSDALASRMATLQTANSKEFNASIAKIADEVRRTASKLELTKLQQTMAAEKALLASKPNMSVRDVLRWGF